MMSWVKNLWNRLFPEDTEELETEVRREEQPAPKPDKIPFRFPVITDEEREEFFRREAAEDQITPIYKESRTTEPRKAEQEKDWERGPRLAPRPERRPELRPASKLAPRPEHRPEPKKRAFEPIPVSKTHRFEPTRVPSPIHGFNERKPATIDQLLEQKETKKEERKTGQSVTQPIPDEVKKPAEATVEKETRKDKVAEDVRLPDSPAATFPEKNEESPALPISASPEEKRPHAELPEVPVNGAEYPPLAEEQPADNVHTSAGEEQEATEVIADAEPAPKQQEQEKKEKTVPFNVLMLKSDKQRIKKMPAAVKEEQKQTPAPEVVESQEKPEQPELLNEKVGTKESAPPQAYHHPDERFLRAPENDRRDDQWMEEQGERLTEALSHFQVQASILSIVQGPAVTQFELTVAQGVKVSKIRNLADDLKLALAARDIRIQAPIPGKSSIGIEIPNRTSRPVRISEVIESPQFKDSDSPLEAALGLDLTGRPVTLDLRKMPHGLIAGATGSGKSVCINSILVSLLFKSSPQDLKLLLIDPKMVELAPYNHIPHLVSPVITDVKAATASLKWAVSEMERRYQLFAHTGVRDISKYNKMVKEKGDHAQHLPYILIVIDELADLMMMSPSDVEDAICRIAQKARACGIHLVIATQRPSVDVITGLIKSNIPTRIAFSVSSQVDSRTILDSQGAERLLGRGDMLYLGNGMSAANRIQGTFVTDEEIEEVIDHVRKQGEPQYFFKEEELIRQNGSDTEQDDLFEEACRFIMQQGSASTSLLQRKFHIGYNRAARLMDLLEQRGFISEQNGSKARSVLVTEQEIEEVFQ